MYDSTLSGSSVPSDAIDLDNSARTETPTTETDYLRDLSHLPPDERAWAASFFGWYRDPTEAEMDEEYQRCLADERRNAEAAANSVASDTSRCEAASSVRPENMATDWLAAAVTDPAGNLPVATGESAAAKLDDARRELSRRYIVNVGVKGRKFTASVETPDGRKVKAGTFACEADAHRAADALAARLRGEAIAVA